MRKNASISGILQGILQEEKEAKRGSLEFQIISLTNKLKKVSLHLQVHKKDYLAERSLRKIIGKRQRLISYLLNKTKIGNKEFISQLNIGE